jgi:hypothetical protein
LFKPELLRSEIKNQVTRIKMVISINIGIDVTLALLLLLHLHQNISEISEEKARIRGTLRARRAVGASLVIKRKSP